MSIRNSQSATRPGNVADRDSRIHVPLSLAVSGQVGLVSRSQARQILAGVERSREVCLDFEGVPSIGQGFADEIFRVFRNAHPEIRLIFLNANEDVRKMIHHVGFRPSER